MTRKICIAALSLLLSASCSHSTQRSPECKTFIRALQEDWLFDEERKIFHVISHGGRSNRDFLSRLMDHRDCLRGRSSRHMRKIFGTPSSVDGINWYYYAKVSCRESEYIDCDFLLLIFDEQDNLKEVEFGARTMEY